jgi:hypothetical protein
MTKNKNSILLIVGLIITMISCEIDQNDSQNRLVTDYIQGLNTRDFNLFQNVYPTVW